ncbi:DUF932 domain-containing protein [Kitasatospora cineracea]|uniref:Phage/plasmid-like protein (TIGR03299 family) n=1 Tax=Kitasatospora cineracea TaxID=88074 RepID=A0A8G1UFC5_9ACTN|nr:DUF932 domain-containing protein [Kitasatospora cineracea]ROR42913.1 phage/plasmid-like protein (TIGR03299 family) [Kitasatospora cineracea]
MRQSDVITGRADRGAIDNTTGEAAFYSHREPAWHGLGTVTEEAKTSDEVIKLAKLDWLVEKRPLLSMNKGKLGKKIPGRFGTFRDDSGDWVGGLVGNTWTPIQNRVAFTFLDELVGGGFLTYETAGALDGGRVVFMSTKSPSITIDPQGAADRIDLYTLFANSHDGRSAAVAVETPVRAVCTNTLDLAVRDAHRVWKIRHTKNALTDLEEARQTLGFTEQYASALEAEATALFQQAMTDQEFDKLIGQLWTPPAEGARKSILAAHEERRDRLHALFAEADTQENIRGTRWAALQTVIEFEDYFRAVKVPEALTEQEHRNNLAMTTLLHTQRNDIKDMAKALLLAA